MSSTMRATCCSLLGAVLCSAVCGIGLAQEQLQPVAPQRFLIQSPWGLQTAAPAYLPSVAQVYVRVPRAAVRRAYRQGYLIVAQPLPYATGVVYAYPSYTTLLPQPAVYQEVWIGSAGSVYRPDYQPPVQQQVLPAPAAPEPIPAPEAEPLLDGPRF